MSVYSLPDIDRLIRERDEARAHLEALSVAATCACSYDNPDDVCMTHQKMKAEAEAAGYRRGVQDAAKVAETQKNRIWHGHVTEAAAYGEARRNIAATILALLEQTGEKK